MTLRFCFSEEHNDHTGYPRGLAEAPPPGWRYRPCEAEFSPTLRRPWTLFDARPGECVHASSLVPVNVGVPWLFDADHPHFLLAQAASSGCGADDLRANEGEMLRALQSPLCFGIVAWSNAAAADFAALFDRTGLVAPEIRAVHPGVVPPAGAPDGAEQRLLDDLRARLRPASVRLLAIDCYAGILEVGDRKNLSDSAIVFAQCLERGLDVELIVVDRTVDSLVSEGRKHRVPRLSRRAIWDVYGLAHILLFLSHSDGYGMVLAEAMSLGLACVAGSAPSSPVVAELIEDGTDGFLVPFARPVHYPGFSSGLALDRVRELVCALVADPALRARIGAEARRRFAAHGPLSVSARNDAICSLVERRISTSEALRSLFS